MEKRIELEKRGKTPSQISDLNLDNCRASQISGLTEEFVNLETLSLINAGLVTLKGFPKLPNLKKLELSDNRISSGLELLHGSPKLQHLNLSGNRIKDYVALEPLKVFHNLINLDLFNCEVTKIEDYRENVFRMIPSLKSLDGYDRNDEEVVDEEEDDDDEDSEDSSDEENRIKRDDGNVNDDDDAEDDGDDVENDEENFDEADDDEEDDDEEDDEDDDEEVDLKYLQKDKIDEESDGDDFDPEGNEDEDDDIDEEDDGDIEPPAADAKRGLKRKHDEEAGDEAEH